MARLRAVVMSHAAGLRGTPSRAQRSRAMAAASWSASSARSMSPRARARRAIARAVALAEGAGDGVVCDLGQANSTIGRTSIAPVRAPGIRRAASIAWSRVSHSTS